VGGNSARWRARPKVSVVPDEDFQRNFTQDRLRIRRLGAHLFWDRSRHPDRNHRRVAGRISCQSSRHCRPHGRHGRGPALRPAQPLPHQAGAIPGIRRRIQGTRRRTCRIRGCARMDTAAGSQAVVAAPFPLEAVAIHVPEPAVGQGEWLEPVRVEPVFGRLRDSPSHTWEQNGERGAQLAVQRTYPDSVGNALHQGALPHPLLGLGSLTPVRVVLAPEAACVP